jgi:hypothetical protein
MSTTSASKSLALELMSGIKLNGSFLFDKIMVFRRTGPGIKIAKPSNPTSPLAAGIRVL